MQTETFPDADAEVVVAGGGQQPESPEVSPYAQALAEIEAQLGALEAAFIELDTLRTQEKQLEEAHKQIVAEEKAILADPSGSEKAAVERLLKVRATRDIRAAKLAAMRKTNLRTH
jgi:hypothetical protein